MRALLFYKGTTRKNSLQANQQCLKTKTYTGIQAYKIRFEIT